jgi:lipopolysaccharide/colanic/teichoic acid biosynthesis glycosyltransferase
MSIANSTRNKTAKRTRNRRSVYHAAMPPAQKIQIPESRRVAGYLRWKTPIDRVLAAILVVPGLLLIGLLAVLVRLTSRGPGLFRQPRVGRNGRIFTLYKIRTMVHNAEEATGAVWCKTNDVRVTRVGRVLRRFHFDEFPQLFNVLKGEMSFVGPRPERPEFVHVLADAVPNYLDRLAASPGITGLAQLNLPPDTDLDSVRRKLMLDLEYVEHAGPLLDARLVMATLLRLVKFPESLALHVLRLHRTVKLPPPGKPSTNGNGQGRPNGASHAAHTAPIVEKSNGGSELTAASDRILRD